MTAAMLRVPASMAGDPSDVAVALEVASALWHKGDNEEAVRWLRRAGEAAEAAGNGPRAAALAQAAAELLAALESAKVSAQEIVANAVPPTLPAPSGVAPDPGSSPSVSSLAPAGASPLRSASKPVAPSRAAPTLFRSHDGRIRVSVRMSARDPNLLVLRPLAEGQTAPAGTREGFLVLDDADLAPRGMANGGGTL